MRVVAGRLGGRQLVAPRDRETRPTADRVREALFSILGAVQGARVLDLYAGTGALGIEAISRGAARAVLVESRRAALDAIGRNVAALGLAPEVFVVARPVERSRAQVLAEGPFDLVLCDPPYALVDRGEVATWLAQLVAEGGLAPSGRLVLEHGSTTPAPAIGGLGAPTSRRYGDSSVSFYEAP